MASHKLSQNTYNYVYKVSNSTPIPLATPVKNCTPLNIDQTVTIKNMYQTCGIEIRYLRSFDGGVTTQKDRILTSYLGPSQSIIVRNISLTQGSKFIFYLKKRSNDHAKTLLSVMEIDPTRPVNEIYVGQVTTRYTSATWDDQIVTVTNGMRWITIHNMTKIPLRLNNNIVVPPLSAYIYRGRHHWGVPLGMKFKDRDGIYSDVIIRKPITDIYYGVISDMPQQFYGGWSWGKLDFTPGDFAYLFEDGIESGVANPSINYNLDYFPDVNLQSFN